jgi:hypothetical protein
MANEITVTASLRVANGNLSVSTPTTSKQFDQATLRGGTFTVDAATSETTVDFGDIVPGFILLQNLDTTNYCEYTTVTTDYDLKLRANGGFALIDLSGTQTLYLKANTAACKIQVTLINT